MKVKTQDIIGPALDWAVAKCEGGTGFLHDGISMHFELHGLMKVLATGWAPSMSYTPSTNWALTGPIIERKKIEMYWSEPLDAWAAKSGGSRRLQYGPTPLVAAMRAYVASRLGGEINIPEELT